MTLRWSPSLTVQTSGWPEGDYLLRLDASTGVQRNVPITVRSASTAGKVVILNGVATWQAYNLWGGYDLYTSPGGFGNRSYVVSFDRPYALTGAAMFLYYEQSAVAIAEKSGVPLAYETDVDLHENPSLLSGARALISLGHDEYYSQEMRATLMAARNAGTNIAFLGANAVYRHIRFASSPLGQDRLVICYKDAQLDPLYGKDNSATTQDWRDPPHARPESVLNGVFYECNPVSAPYVVYDPSSWIFANTGASKGTDFPNLVGVEYDRMNPAVPFPRPMTVLAHSPLTCAGTASYADGVHRHRHDERSPGVRRRTRRSNPPGHRQPQGGQPGPGPPLRRRARHELGVMDPGIEYLRWTSMPGSMTLGMGQAPRPVRANIYRAP